MIRPFYPTTSELPLLLEGRQTAIVRPMNPQPEFKENESIKGHWATFFHGWNMDHRLFEFADIAKYCPFGPEKTILWCKESHFTYGYHTIPNMDFISETIYKADDPALPECFDSWSSLVTMPKSACRLWLEVLEVRVCKLMDLTNEEMYETGVRIDDSYRLGISTGCEGSVEGFNLGEGIRRVFYEIFEEKFGKRKVTNPWIWYDTVTRIEKP